LSQQWGGSAKPAVPQQFIHPAFDLSERKQVVLHRGALLRETTMKLLALIAAAGSLAAFASPAQAAELPALSTPMTANTSPVVVAITPVAAYGDPHWRDRRDWRHDRRWDNGRRLHRRDRVWRGNDGRYRCRRDDGTVGLVIGAGVGALLGREIDRSGDRTLGTVLGAVGGGLLGREIDRGDLRCR
jgi:hypothetical protein